MVVAHHAALSNGRNVNSMKRLVSKLSLLMAIAAAVAMFGQSSAYAVGADAAVVVGSGTITPGLTTVPTAQSFTFTTANLASVPSVAVGASTNGGVFAGTINCSFNGSSPGETVATGVGAGSGTCTAPAGPGGTSGAVSCASLTYFRVGALVVVVLDPCTATVNGNSNNSGLGAGAFVFVPTSANPTTSYQLVGASAGAATNVSFTLRRVEEAGAFGPRPPSVPADPKDSKTS
jgi:hypothetical protein